MFPEPIGKRKCFHTLHSEPATIPASFKDKGVKEVTWRLSLPAEFDQKARILASVGFASKEPVEVQGSKVIPCEVLAAVIEKNVKEKLEGVELKLNEIACIRSHVIGKKGNKKVEYIVDCIARTPSRGTSLTSHITGVPNSIVTQMQAKGMIKEPGVWGPEQVVESEYFFEELAKREFQVQVTTKEYLT
jgi:saccharopine dehydrogenase-like NADP-dependent oxidoreductase